MHLLNRLSRLLLTDDRQQRIRLAQAGLASLLMLYCVGCMQVGAALGIVERGWPLVAWTATSVIGFVAVGAVIRSGLTRRLADPSLTTFQMVYSIACAAWGYAIAGSAHAFTPMMVAVILMFGMFGMSTRQVVWVALYAASLFGAVMAWCSAHDPDRYPPRTDLLVFLVMLAVLAGVVILTMRLHRMRDRMKERSLALQEAVAQIERLATHDELTGLVNRRHMQQLLEEERARSQRDRHPWCVALIDIDHFKRINDAHGHACGDEVLRALGQRAAALIRRTDSLCRWGGEEFVLLLPGATLTTAQSSIDRVREHFHEHPLQVGAISLSLSFSAGVTEHRFGESVAQTLERADQLAYRAKQHGRNRVEPG
jgi:diguanylate cyclase (GGDEF)-like protein